MYDYQVICSLLVNAMPLKKYRNSFSVVGLVVNTH
uniref:Uncharacterized protein n=1 Tax=Arundo donax TaxID=35708 RepID=A0A0A9DH55_ARUDO